MLCALPQSIYESATAELKRTPGYSALLQIPDTRPELTQASDDFDTVYRQAEEARQMQKKALFASSIPQTGPNASLRGGGTPRAPAGAKAMGGSGKELPPPA